MCWIGPWFRSYAPVFEESSLGADGVKKLTQINQLATGNRIKVRGLTLPLNQLTGIGFSVDGLLDCAVVIARHLDVPGRLADWAQRA